MEKLDWQRTGINSKESFVMMQDRNLPFLWFDDIHAQISSRTSVSLLVEKLEFTIPAFFPLSTYLSNSGGV